jgi:hypothetical protein
VRRHWQNKFATSFDTLQCQTRWGAAETRVENRQGGWTRVNTCETSFEQYCVTPVGHQMKVPWQNKAKGARMQKVGEQKQEMCGKVSAQCVQKSLAR